MKKLDVNQELCRKVQIMLAGAKMGEVAELLGISKTTVSRIKAAGFEPEQYARNTQKRVEKENLAEEQITIPIKPGKVIRVDQKPDGITVTEMEEEQVPGQICMELQPAEEQKPEMSEQTKLMRFLGGKFADNAADVAALAGWIVKVNSTLEKINDNLCQVLRKLDG